MRRRMETTNRSRPQESERTHPIEADRFDTLARSLSVASTRRTLVRLLATVPVAGGLLTRLTPDDILAGKGKHGKRGHGRNGGHGGKGGHGHGHKGRRGT